MVKMGKTVKIFIILGIIVSLNGCLLFHKVSYDVVLEDPEKGTATVTFYDIRSDARNDTEFKQDQDNIFTFILKGNEFITEIKKEGKNITSRELFVVNDSLNGKAVFNFTSISAVEKIIYEDGFFYLTLPLQDSVISTNGEVIVSKDYKRILWNGAERHLKFEIFSTDFSEGEHRKLAPYYKK
jgi:hypothetical protein